MINFKDLNWPTVTFLIVSPVVAVAGVVWWIAAGHFNFLTLGLTLFLIPATALGITAGYHRLYAHRSFDAPWPVRLTLMALGGACFEMSVWDWCVDHRKHHNHIDEETDPYNINRGFWYAHILWLFHKEHGDGIDLLAPDLQNDPMVRFQHRYYLPLASLVSFGLPVALASLWGDAMGGLLVAGFFRLVLNHHLTFAINSVCHTFGTQNYSDRHSARDNWVTAFLTFGEGYHNYHHEFPSDYRNGIRFYHWDPTKWLIRALAFMRLARRLNVVHVETILTKKLFLKEKKLSKSLAEQPSAFVAFANQILESSRTQMQQAADRLKSLRQRYWRLKKLEKDVVLQKLRVMKAQVRQAEREFRHSVALCESMIRRLNKLSAVSSRRVAAAVSC